jgi:spoIIIJ-associated protein
MDTNTFRDFLANLIQVIGFQDAEITLTEIEPQRLKADIQLTESGLFIGNNGENLYAFEHICRLMAAKFLGPDIGLMVDANNYNAFKEEKLRELARKAERTVMLMGKAVDLQPMPSRDRRIIHTELSESEEVTTESLGERDGRHIVVRPKKLSI